MGVGLENGVGEIIDFFFKPPAHYNSHVFIFTIQKLTVFLKVQDVLKLAKSTGNFAPEPQSLVLGKDTRCMIER